LSGYTEKNKAIHASTFAEQCRNIEVSLKGPTPEFLRFSEELPTKGLCYSVSYTDADHILVGHQGGWDKLDIPGKRRLILRITCISIRVE